VQESSTNTEAWIVDRVEHLAHRRLARAPTVRRDTSNFMAIDRDDVVELGGELYLVTCTEQERRFGLEGEPKFWVKRALSLATGRMHILKLVFHEVFLVHIRTQQIRCVRSAEKEGRVLDLTRGDERFMQGRAVRDSAGNLVRVLDFISGVDLLTRLNSRPSPHEEYFRGEFPALLARTVDAMAAIARLHEAGLCHGDIRNDHVLVDHGSGRFKWIDFDLMQESPDFDVWALGNILHCVVGQGFVTFQQVMRDRPDLAPLLSTADASVFFPNRIMNLEKVYPYVPAKLNAVLMRFAEGGGAPYASVQQIVDDLRDCLADCDHAATGQAGGIATV